MEVIEAVKHYQRGIQRCLGDEQRMLHCLNKLYRLPVTVQHLQETGIGRTVNSLRKEKGEAGEAAKALVLKWKAMVAAEESSDAETSEKDTTESSKTSSHKYKSTSISYEDVHSMERKKSSSHKSDSDSHNHMSDSSNRMLKDKSSHHKSSRHKDQSYKRKYVEESKRVDGKRRKNEEVEEDSSDEESYIPRKVGNEYTSQINGSSNVDEREQEYDKELDGDDLHRGTIANNSSSEEEESGNNEEEEESRVTSFKSNNHKSRNHYESHHKHEKHKDKERNYDHGRSKKEDKKRETTSKLDMKTNNYKIKEKDKYQHEEKKYDETKKEKERKNEKGKLKTDSHIPKTESKSSTSSKSKVSKHESKSKDTTKSKTKSFSDAAEDGIDSCSGTSFADALGMMGMAEPQKKKKKSSGINAGSKRTETNHEASTSKYTSSQKNKPMHTDRLPIEPASFVDDFNLLTPSVKLEPLDELDMDVDVDATLPAINPNYRPLPHVNLDGISRNRCKLLTEEEALSQVMSTKNQRTKVYSGVKSGKSWATVPSLYDICIRVLQENIEALGYTGGVPYDLLKPVLSHASAEQLFVLEHYNPYLIEDTDPIWEFHCKRKFRNTHRLDMETFREMYMRCVDEQEAKLKALTTNIQISMAKSTPVRQTKLAYVDSMAKPPRQVARKQAKFGTAHATQTTPLSKVQKLASPTSAGASTSSGEPSVVRVPPKMTHSVTKVKPRMAPLMQKTMKLAKSFKR